MELRLVAIGASAGGVTALGDLLAALPTDLPATLLVGLHLSSAAPSLLAQVLNRRSTLPVRVAEDGVALQPGIVHVCPPDRHLLVADGRVRLGTGARENGHRPSHDAMLRATALEAGPHAVGVVLTGLLDDGAAGLRCIARYGGTCLVQDPGDADFPDMPRNALAAVPDARSAPLEQLAALITAAVTAPPSPAQHVSAEHLTTDRAGLASAWGRSSVPPDGSHPGQPSPFACPDCHEVLDAVTDGPDLRYRCRTGHAWTAHSLLEQQREAVERALWVALRSLQEQSEMFRRLAAVAERQQLDRLAAGHRARSAEAERSADALRTLLTSSPTASDAPSTDR